MRLTLSGKLGFAGIILLPWLTIFQSLHHVDEGFILANFLYFFSHPELVNYGFTHYLTDLIGALVVKISGPHALLGIRIGSILILYASLYIAYRLVKEAGVEKNMNIIGLFCSYLFLNNVDTINWIHYSPLTGLFLLGFFYSLFLGLKKDSVLLILLSGIILGASTFLRLPNIVFIYLVVLIPIFYIIQNGLKITFQKRIILSIFKKCLLLISGYSIGLSVIISIIISLGHQEYIKEAIYMIFGMAKEGIETRNHGITYLLYLYIKSAIFVLLIGGTIMFTQLVIFKSGNSTYSKLILTCISGIMLGIIAISKSYFQYEIYGLSILISYASFIFPFVVFLGIYQLKGGFSKDFYIIYSIGVLLLFSVGLGSGGYLEMMMYASPILMPMLFSISKSLGKGKILGHYFSGILIVIVVSSSISTLHILWRNNFPFTYTHIDTIRYLNIPSEKESEITTLRNYFSGKKEIPLLFLSNFGYGSYFYYLFDLKPYIGNSVPAYYPLEVLAEKIQEKLDTGNTPLLLVDKYNGIENNNSYRQHGENATKLAFDVLQKKGYDHKLSFETDNFLIYEVIKL